MRQYRKIIVDVILNVIATAVPLLVLQLIILPLLATQMDDDGYGLLLTIISAVTIIANSLGNALNNIRLIKNGEYEKEQIQGDFQILIIGEMILGVIITAVSLGKYKIGVIDIILILLMTMMWIAREYYIVVFRLYIDFKGIVINNIIMVAGYAVGLILNIITGYWEFIYIIGLLFSLVYTLRKNRIVFEKIIITPLFKGTLMELLFLVVASLVGNLLNYADRLIIYPLIGGMAVSIYYASTLFGKIVSTAISPLNSVVLSYLAKKESLQQKLLIKVLGSSCVIACVGYIVCRIIAYPALCILYPQWADDSMKYVPITTLIAMITMMTSALSPFVLKFCKMKWQLIMNISVLLIYLSVSIVLFKRYGMMGFCFGVLISNIVKLLIVVILGLRATKKANF